jgi:hypothetical protein
MGLRASWLVVYSIYFPRSYFLVKLKPVLEVETVNNLTEVLVVLFAVILVNWLCTELAHVVYCGQVRC